LNDTSYALINLFADGGFMMYPLLLASLLGVGVIIAKAYILYAIGSRGRKVIDEAHELGVQGRTDEAIALAESTRGPSAAVLAAGLRQVHDRRDARDVEKAMSSAGAIELGFLERGLVLLATVATVAPLMGFLGTVWGMIAAFAAIEAAGQVEAGLVAAGIKIALITTATGLAIAIPINIGYNYFVNRIDQLIVEMEEGVTAVTNVLWDLDRGAVATTGASSVAPARGSRATKDPLDMDTQGSIIHREDDPGTSAPGDR
jgi:biopolymer transport protein ExbB